MTKDKENIIGYVARGANHWGVGSTAQEAVRRMRERGAQPEGHVVHKLPDGIKNLRIGSSGVLSWDYEDESDSRSGTGVALEVVEDTINGNKPTEEEVDAMWEDHETPHGQDFEAGLYRTDDGDCVESVGEALAIEVDIHENEEEERQRRIMKTGLFRRKLEDMNEKED